MKTQISLSILALTAIAGSSVSANALFQWGDDAELHFVGDLAYVYEDNLFLQSSNTVSDTHYEFTPGFELRLSPRGSASTTITYKQRFTFYQKVTELDDSFADFSFVTKYDSGVALNSGYITYKEQYSNTFDLDSSSDVYGVLIPRNTTAVGGSSKYSVTELTSMKVAVDYASVDYDDIVMDGQAYDFYSGHDTYSVPVTVFYKVRPKVDLTAGVRYRSTDTDANVEYSDWYYYVGAVGELFSPVIYADLSVGYQNRNAKGSLADSDSATYKMSIIYTGNAKGSVYATLARDYRTSAANGQSYAFANVAVGGNYALSTAVSLNAAFVYGESEYEESIRAEDITIVQLGASYNPNDFVTLKASFSMRDVDGNVANYKDNEFRVTASLRY